METKGERGALESGAGVRRRRGGGRVRRGGRGNEAHQKEKDEKGNLIFACKYVTEEGLCSVYNNRLKMCKNYPAKSIRFYGELHKGCGYKIEKPDFKNYLK